MSKGLIFKKDCTANEMIEKFKKAMCPLEDAKPIAIMITFVDKEGNEADVKITLNKKKEKK